MFNVQALLESLPMMGYGMLGIFIAIFAIILTVVDWARSSPQRNSFPPKIPRRKSGGSF